MPYAINKGVRIHYEVEGSGPPLVCHHGFGGCIEDWREAGLVEPLGKQNQLIILDARGCGASDKPHDPAAYEPAVRASDITAVLDELGIAKTNYYGHSYGGALAWALAKYIPQRINSLIISGSHPYASSAQVFRDLLRQGIDAFLTFADRLYGPYMNPGVRARLAKNDTAALSAASLDRPDYTGVLPTMRMPCLLLTGALDPICANVQKAAPMLPNAELVVLPDCDHVANFCRADVVVPPVLAFLARVAG